MWFSARLRFAIMVEPEGAVEYADSVYIFQMKDENENTDPWGEALRHAIRLGEQQETDYRNFKNRQVRWRLKEVTTLDMIRSTNLDGAEVYAEFVSLGEDEKIPFDTLFHPATSCPEQTGI
jgi:hypothetical protein